VAHSRGFPRGRLIQNRRKTTWDFGPGGTAPQAISGSGSILLVSALISVVNGITLVRLRGAFRWYLTLATNPGDGFQGAFGVGIATSAAVVAGAAAVPTPLTEQGSDNWMYWRAIGIHGPVASSTSLNDATVESFEVDSKAMRKFPTEMSIYAAVELVEIGTATADLFFDSRVLGKLP